MNSEQMKSAARWIIATFGGFLAGFGASRGWFKAEDFMAILNTELVVGFLTAGIALIWGIVAKTFPGLVSAATRVPDVKSVTVTDQKLAEAVRPDAEAKVVVSRA